MMDVFKLVLFYMFCCLGGRWWLMLLFLGSGFACDLISLFLAGCVLWCLCLGAGVLCFRAWGLCVAWPFLCVINASAVLPLMVCFCSLCGVALWWYDGDV